MYADPGPRAPDGHAGAAVIGGAPSATITSAAVGRLGLMGRCMVCGGGCANSDCDGRSGGAITSGCIPTAAAGCACVPCDVEGRESAPPPPPPATPLAPLAAVDAARRNVGSLVCGRTLPLPPPPPPRAELSRSVGSDDDGARSELADPLLLPKACDIALSFCPGHSR